MRAKEINAAADLYFVAHSQELLEEAWRKVQGCPDLMRFYEKEQRERQRRLAQNSQVTCSAEIRANQPLPLNETHAQNGAQR